MLLEVVVLVVPDLACRWADGLEPARTPYASFADFGDPDGNVWTLQERP
jgi:hypothetical protein